MNEFQLNPLLSEDGYKTSHHKMYRPGTTMVYSNFTTRDVNRMPEQAKDIVVFGIQYTIKYIKDLYDKNFFNQPKNIVCGEAKEYLSKYLNCDYDVSHFEALHDLGYLPIKVKALEEGSVIGSNIPMMTIYNTIPQFYWVPNFLETLISSLLWKPVHSASMAYAFKKILLKNALETDKDNMFSVNFQGHDFSFRGMQHLDSAISSGLGWITSFMGTDTIPVLQAAKYYYNSDNVAFSVSATEHSVASSLCDFENEYDDNGNIISVKTNELNGIKHLLNIYSTGILSMVSDTYDLWRMCTEYLPQLKNEIMSRDGKLVIRPDSGNPVDIVCGLGKKPGTWSKTENGKYYYSENAFVKTISEYEISEGPYKGLIELLWETFGGTINSQGFKVLDPHIGAIYGDAITLDRAEQICDRLKRKGFATTNIVFGIGSYSLGCASRDNQGGAVKCTYIEVNGIGREVFKDPITDRGTKKSAKGLLKVYRDENSDLRLKDQCTWEEENSGELSVIFENGEIVKETTIGEIRNKLNK